MKVTIIEPSLDFENERHVEYVVIISKYQDKYLFVRHQHRTTFEIPGGKIELGETPLQAAHRELAEETGAILFSLKKLFYYEVATPLKTDYGIVFVADITQKSDDLKFEIREVIVINDFPENCTYPLIQPKIFTHYLRDNS